ncbi:hypothetical protein AJ78_02415 [Emergomyces pasteurianus Ep9510]|uniref:Uncharacterized protein n=1 Tax=Emergomyces pasteurianus Ep9510 TaxID=1447872 RepID=A0A1J9PMZ6_9EURO|nr:hypothetical protein AJ78_02415 [Emergomyces pasteurianus Ep9510]
MATSTMSSSLTRAFTKRHQKPVVVSAPMPYREGQQKFAAGTIKRKEISLPVQLVSTTNLLAYNAPDLPKSKPGNKKTSQSHQSPELKKSAASPAISSSSSFLSGSDSDITNLSSASSSSSSIPSPSHSSGTPVTSPDLSTEEVSPNAPEPNHLSSYFDSPKRSKTHHYTRSSTSSSTSQTPKLPHRSLSHTKRSHQELARQRSLSKGSVQSQTPPPPPLSSSSSQTASLTHSQSHSNSHSINRSLSTHSNRSSRLSQERLRQVPESSNFSSTSISTANSTPPHPFGKELEQVNEVAEEFASVQHAVIVEEEQMLAQRGLFKFAVEDYIMEIEGLYRSIFDDVVGYNSKGYGGDSGGTALVSGNAWI